MNSKYIGKCLDDPAVASVIMYSNSSTEGILYSRVMYTAIGTVVKTIF